MVDNRSAGYFGIGGSFNFKSGDISGTAAKTQDDKMGQGSEYGAPPEKDEDQNNSNNEPYVDRSAQLRATLNSLAMMNVANVINAKKRPNSLKDEDDLEFELKNRSNEDYEFDEELSEEPEEDEEYY